MRQTDRVDVSQLVERVTRSHFEPARVFQALRYRYRAQIGNGSPAKISPRNDGSRLSTLCRRSAGTAMDLSTNDHLGEVSGWVESQTAEGNAMPEPTRDRPSRNYEFLFLFSKRPNYYFDRTPLTCHLERARAKAIERIAGSVWQTSAGPLTM